MEEIRISSLEKAEQRQGPKGPYWMVRIKDSKGRYLGGFVSVDKYIPQDWQPGGSFFADVEQNGKYLNFKLPNYKRDSPPKQQAQGSPNQALESLARVESMLKEILSRLPASKQTSSGMTHVGSVLDPYIKPEDNEEEDPFSFG